MSEFDWVRRIWQPLGDAIRHPQVVQGIGDDGARLRVPDGHELVVSVDTLIEGVHFPENAPPQALGWRALAVNLSDLAAMGAEPVAYTLALTVPHADEAWCRGFARGLEELAKEAGIQLIGGDTARGPLSLTIQVMGTVPQGQALTRGGARAGDLVVVSGNLGGAAAALDWLEQPNSDPRVEALLERYYRPQPRWSLGLSLRHRASAAIDVSDGLVADLEHLLGASSVGAELDADSLPLHPALSLLNDPQRARQLALSGGDDYELCFTWPESEQALWQVLPSGTEATVVGRITAGHELTIRSSAGTLDSTARGYDHFRD